MLVYADLEWSVLDVVSPTVVRLGVIEQVQEKK